MYTVIQLIYNSLFKLQHLIKTVRSSYLRHTCTEFNADEERDSEILSEQQIWELRKK